MKTNKNTLDQVHLLHDGKESALTFFYENYYKYLFYRAEKRTQDICTAESIVQEAFLRLWLFRDKIHSEKDIKDFLRAQVNAAVNTFYQKSGTRFQRSLLRLDGIEDYQEFMLGYELEEEEEVDTVYLEQLEEEKQERLNKLKQLMPNLKKEQQQFIELCLKYSFNYERIAYYLGGISDYQVSLEVERTIETLRNVFNSSEKMQIATTSDKYVLQGEFNEQQAEIFRMRYDLQYSFEQISEALKLNSSVVKKIFIETHTKIKQTKKTA